MIKFEKITARRFLSIGEDPIVLGFTQGLNVITGTNKDKGERSNGSGKSTIIEAVFFAIFGKTMKKLPLANIVNDKLKKKAEVILEFSIGDIKYKIIRRLKPSELLFYIDGVDKSRDSAANTQEEIANVIGATEDVIKNSVILCIDLTVPFFKPIGPSKAQIY